MVSTNVVDLFEINNVVSYHLFVSRNDLVQSRIFCFSYCFLQLKLCERSDNGLK